MNLLWIILGIIGAACLALVLNHDAGSVLGVESNQFASLVWYGLWGLLLGAAILPRRGQLRESARNAVIWLGIILMLTAGYGYRYELQDVASRVSGGLVPGSPISQRMADGRLQATLIRASSGHFTAVTQVNDRSMRMLVDTGASLVVLTQSDARAAGIDPDSLSYTARVSTANGVTTAAPVTLSSVAVGDIARRNVQAMVARPGALSESLLGMNFLSSLTAFEFRGDRLILTD